VALAVVSTPVRPTEDPGKVVAAVVRLFPGSEVERHPASLRATCRDLRPLRGRIWELRIIDTVRAQVLRGMATDGRSTRFRLSKQAASAHKVSFPPMPHPLGDLDVEVLLEEGDPWASIEAWAYWLCPETKDGEIVGPVGGN
jgi:predicted RNA binding protein with dsRBD fold (UPF0201 family)